MFMDVYGCFWIIPKCLWIIQKHFWILFLDFFLDFKLWNTSIPRYKIQKCFWIIHKHFWTIQKHPETFLDFVYGFCI